MSLKAKPALAVLASFLGALLFISLAPAQNTPPRPISLELGKGPGLPSDIPGISRIEVALSLGFEGPVNRADVASLTARANGVEIPASVIAAGRWDQPGPRVLRFLVPLDILMDAGISYLPDTNALRVECILARRDGTRFSAASTFDFLLEDEAPEIHRAAGRFVLLETPGPPPVKPVERPEPRVVPSVVSRGPQVAEKVIGPEGGRVEAPGEAAVIIPAGALSAPERIRISRVPDSPAGTRLFVIDRDREGAWFDEPVEVVINAASLDAAPGSPPLAIQELEGPLWKSLPTRYDAAAKTITCRVFHFSPIGGITKRHVKIAAGSAIGAAVGYYLVCLTPAGVLSLPGLAIIAAATWTGGTAINPVLDEVQKFGLNGSARFGDEYRIFWADNPSSSHHIAEDCFAALVDPANGAVIELENKAALTDAAALSYANKIAGESARPFDRIVQTRIPKSVIYLAAELAWVETFFQKGGFAALADKTPAPISRPLDILIYGLSSAGTRDGEWDGTKLLLDRQLFVRAVLAKYASADIRYPKARQATTAHEYWHAVYTWGGYHSSFRSYDWFNECMGIAFESEVFPDRDLFLDSHPASGVKISLATGFDETGTVDGDDNRSLRGYKLWPWGKFLLNKGYDKVIDFARGLMPEAEIGRLFNEFALALVCQDRELPDRKPSPPPLEGFEGSKYVIRFPEGMENPEFTKSISPTSGWSKLGVNEMMSGQTFGLGASVRPTAGAAAANPGAARALSSPRKLSFVLAELQFNPPQAAVELARAGTPPPVVVRRKVPDQGELIIGLHPSSQNPSSGRRRLADLVQGKGQAAIPGAWLNFQASLAIPVALAGSFPLSAGSDNPIWAYVLLPPEKIRITPGPQNIQFNWDAPGLGAGLKPEDVHTGYRVYVQKGTDAPRMVPDLLLPARELKAEVPAGLIGEADRIGLSAEDAVVVDQNETPLRSPIGWGGVVVGEVTVFTSKPNPDKKSPFDEEPLSVPVAGAQVACEFTEKGKAVRLTATSDKDGRARFTVPLDTPITLTWGNEKDTATCTARVSKVSVVLGGVKIKTVSTSPVIKKPPLR